MLRIHPENIVHAGWARLQTQVGNSGTTGKIPQDGSAQTEVSENSPVDCAAKRLLSVMPTA